MKVVLYSNEVIPAKLRVDQYLYSHQDDVRIVFLPLIVEETTKLKQYETIKHYYNEIGIETVNYFDFTRTNSSKVIETLKQYEVFHFSGGNTLETLQFLKESGLDDFFRTLVRGNNIFIGHCGGAVLLSRNTSWIRLRTETLENVLDDYRKYQGLGLVNFEFLPHYNRFKKEKEFMKKIREYSIGIKNSIYSCNDGDGILIEDGNTTFIGNLVEFSHGDIYPL